MLKTVDLTKIYAGEVMALDGVNLSVREGEFLSVMGPSGSGKSTLLHLLGALDRPTSGEIVFAGKKLSEVRDLDHFRSRMVGFIFQMHNLIPTLTARENIEIPMRAAPASHHERRKKIEALLELVGMADRANHLPSRLSGGQRQRVAIARALANHPQILLADEPTGNLDTASGAEVMAVFRQLNQEQGMTVLVVTHAPAIARGTKRMVVLEDGQIVRDEPVGPAYIEDLREFRASGLGQALLAGKLPDEVRRFGLETLLPGLQLVLQNM
ncbi:MAG: ABC transporter ATP-binding protein [Anaerolineales bacterium]|nr:ABC transporter ATP-binding protein [Anaerolineales bacterium]